MLHRWAGSVHADRGLLCDVMVWLTAVSQMKWVGLGSWFWASRDSKGVWRLIFCVSLRSCARRMIKCVFHRRFRIRHKPSANHTHICISNLHLSLEKVSFRGDPECHFSQEFRMRQIYCIIIRIFMYDIRVWADGGASWEGRITCATVLLWTAAGLSVFKLS